MALHLGNPHAAPQLSPCNPALQYSKVQSGEPWTVICPHDGVKYTVRAGMTLSGLAVVATRRGTADSQKMGAMDEGEQEAKVLTEPDQISGVLAAMEAWSGAWN